jgi:hypothetical protein
VQVQSQFQPHRLVTEADASPPETEGVPHNGQAEGAIDTDPYFDAVEFLLQHTTTGAAHLVVRPYWWSEALGMWCTAPEDERTFDETGNLLYSVLRRASRCFLLVKAIDSDGDARVAIHFRGRNTRTV